MAGAARSLQCALGGGAVALGQARGGRAFGLPGGCAAREQARRCSSPTPSEESAEGGGPGAASGGPKADVNVRLACLETETNHLKEGQKELKDEVRKMTTGDTPFLKELKDDVRKMSTGDTLFLKELKDEVRKMTTGDTPFLKELKDDVRKMSTGDTPFLKELKDEVRKMTTGDTPFLKELAADTRAVLRWQQRAVGFAACASLFAAYALRHMLIGM